MPWYGGGITWMSGHLAKLPFRPISALHEKFYHRNIGYMHPKGTSSGAPVIKFFVCLGVSQVRLPDIERKC